MDAPSNQPTIKPEEKETITDNAKKVVGLIKQLNTQAEAGNLTEFIPAAKTTLITINSLRQNILEKKEANSVMISQKLLTVSKNLIQTAKEYCLTQTEQSRKDYLAAKQAIAQQLQDILFQERVAIQNTNPQPTNPSLKRLSSPSGNFYGVKKDPAQVMSRDVSDKTFISLRPNSEHPTSLSPTSSPRPKTEKFTKIQINEEQNSVTVEKPAPVSFRSEKNLLSAKVAATEFSLPERGREGRAKLTNSVSDVFHSSIKNYEQGKSEPSRPPQKEPPEPPQRELPKEPPQRELPKEPIKSPEPLKPDRPERPLSQTVSPTTAHQDKFRKEKVKSSAVRNLAKLQKQPSSLFSRSKKVSKNVKIEPEVYLKLLDEITQEKALKPVEPQKRQPSPTPKPVEPVESIKLVRPTRIAQQSDDEPGKLDAILRSIEKYFPNMHNTWDGLDVDKKKELRNTIDDQLLKFELEERMGLLCSKLRLSKGFSVIKKFCKCTINFMGGILACLREIDNNLCDAHSTTTDRQLLFKAAFYKFIEYLQLLAIDQLSHFQNAPEELLAVIKAVSKAILDIKDCDFYACDQYLVNSIRPHNINTYEYQLQQLIWYCINDINRLITRIIECLYAIHAEEAVSKHIHWEYVSSLHALASYLIRVVNLWQTAKVLSKHRYSNSLDSGNENPEDLEELIDVDIWAEKANQQTSNTPVTQGTLNFLIQTLTSHHDYDLNFLKTFIYTYQSFTTPTQLFHKLTRRFDVPDHEKQHAEAIQLRVCVVLKYWIQNQFLDFDDELVEVVFDFLENTVQSSGHLAMVNLIGSLLSEKVEERNALSAKVNLLAEHIHLNDTLRAPIDLLMSFPVDEIARQMTLIDISLLRKIQPSELMKQAWNTPKLRHRSMYVNLCMERLNMVSYWVPTVILSFPFLKDRKKAVTWFYNLVIELRKLNNYQSLMAIICGFNTSPLQRLKYTLEVTDKELSKKYSALEESMSPTGSFKNYRGALQKTIPPTIPYLGVYLSDLVFIDEGNQDTVNGLINFQKHELVYKTVESLQLYQSSVYSFPQVEPIHKLVEVLPVLPEKILYQLSLVLEPRNANKEEIA